MYFFLLQTEFSSKFYIFCVSSFNSEQKKFSVAIFTRLKFVK